MPRKLTFGLVLGLAFAMLAAPVAAEEHEQPFVRVTYICQVDPDHDPQDGNHASLYTGVDHELHPAEPGDHVWRIGDPRDAEAWTGDLDEADFWAEFPGGLGSQGVEGIIARGEAQFHMTADGANGVSVSTDPGPNLYTGTASVSGEFCEMVQPAAPQPPAKDECKNGGYADLGFRNQGLCIASKTANDNARPHN